MPTLHYTLRNTILDRADVFRTRISRQLGELTTGGPGIGLAVELFAVYVSALEQQVELALNSPGSDRVRLELLRRLLQELNSRIDLFDDRFSRGHARVPRSLINFVEKECSRFGLQNRQPVLTIGPPGNFDTVVVDLKCILFDGVSPTPQIPDHLDNFQPVMIALPDLEGTRPSWQPVIVGHELAHYFQASRPLQQDLWNLLDIARVELLSDLPETVSMGGKLRALQFIISRWQNEITCDAYAVHRYGAAGVASLAEFLHSVGAMEEAATTHPPGYLRTKLMLNWLTEGDSPSHANLIVGPFRPLATPPQRLPDWVEYLAEILLSASGKIWTDVDAWVGQEPYGKTGRNDVVVWLANQFKDGIPGGVIAPTAPRPVEVEAVDVVNASWLALTEGTDKPVHRLAAKALDDLDFVGKWREAGGQLADFRHDEQAPEVMGALSKSALLGRLNSPPPYGIQVTPALPNSVEGVSMDVRLGNHFIIFHQSSAAAFDALDETQDPRSMQYTIEKSWGETFYLHPDQLVLASTLEYIVVPADLAAHVVTRSSYGRLGMLSAAAVQVHPLFAGCLTLELVNLGEMPLIITPGERVAQLTFFQTGKSVMSSSGRKYRYPTGPEFSKIRLDEEGHVLRKMRANFRGKHGH